MAKTSIQNLWHLFCFDLFFKIVSAAILFPISTWAFTSFLSSSGRIAISDSDFFSVIGIIAILLALLAGATLLFAEHGGMILLFLGMKQKVKSSATQILWHLTKNAVRLLHLAGMIIALHLMVWLPFIAGGLILYVLLLSSYDINYLIISTPPVWWFFLSLVSLLIIGALILNTILYLSWVFSLPSLLIKKQSPLEALRSGQTMMKNSSWKKKRFILFALIVLVFLPGLINLFLNMVATGLFHFVPNKISIIIPAVVIFLGLNLFNYLIASFVCVSFNSYAITKTYEGSQNKLPSIKSILKPEKQVLFIKVFKPLVWGLSILALAISAGFSTYEVLTINLDDNVSIMAHRGSSIKAPENTLSAIRQAVIDKADYAEIDVRETKDGVVILFHDTDLLKVAGIKKKIWEVSFNELRRIDVGSLFSPDFAGEKIPTLREAIREARNNILLNVELKYHKKDQKLAEKVMRILDEEDFLDEAIITSFSYPALKKVREINPNIKTGFIIQKSVGQITKMDVDMLSVSMRMACWDLILSAQQEGLEVLVWTVNDPKEMERFIDLGANAIITDKPDVLYDVLQERSRLEPEERLLLRIRHWLW